MQHRLEHMKHTSTAANRHDGWWISSALIGCVMGGCAGAPVKPGASVAFASRSPTDAWPAQPTSAESRPAQRAPGEDRPAQRTPEKLADLEQITSDAALRIYSLYMLRSLPGQRDEDAFKKFADARKMYAAGSYLPAGAMFLEAAQKMLPSDRQVEIAHTSGAGDVQLTCRNAGLAYLMGGQEAQLKQEAAKATWPCQQGLEHSLTLASPVKITYLANEGVLVQAFGRTIVIDGLHRFYGPEYAVLPDPQREQLEQAKADYGKIDVVIASHRHGDHFSAEATLMHLQENPQAVFYGPPQTVKLLLALAGSTEVAARVHAIDATPGASTTVTVPGKPATELEFLGLRHVGKRHTAVENLGVVVTLDGVKVLHVGDAVGDAANLARFGLVGRKLDAALIPFWYLDTPSSRRVVAEQIAARRVFAFHIDPRDGVGVHAEPEAWLNRWPGGVPMVDTLRVWPIFGADTSD